MHPTGFGRRLRVLWLPLLAALCVAPALSATDPMAPTLSGPSTARVATVAKFSGSGFAPNKALSVSVTAPDKREAHFGAVTSADGSLTYPLLPSAPGPYLLRVLDTSGKVLTTLTVHVAP